MTEEFSLIVGNITSNFFVYQSAALLIPVVLCDTCAFSLSHLSPSAKHRGTFFASAGILTSMPLPQTIAVRPEWVAAQNPAQWLMAPEAIVFASWRSPKRRTEWLAGRLAAKKLVQDIFRLEPLDFAIGREGDAPCLIGQSIPKISLSLSHSDGYGAATISDIQQEGIAGIDVQRVRPVHPGLSARAFTLAEQKQIANKFGPQKKLEGILLFWSLKEAAIKTRRIAWGRSLHEIEVRLTEPNRANIKLVGEAPMAAAYEWLDGWWLTRAVRPVLPP